MKRVIALLIAVIMTMTVFCCASGVSATEDTPDVPVVSDTTVATEASSSQSDTAATSASQNDTTESTAPQGDESKATEPSESTTESSEVTQPTQNSESTSTNPTETESTAPTQTESTEPTTEKIKKPKAVSSFKVAKKTTKSVKLQWKTSKDISKYQLYRAVESKKSTFDYKLYKNINKKKTAYQDKNVVTGKVYKYKIFAVKVKSGKTLRSKGKATSCFIPLLPTEKLKVSKASSTSVSLSWRTIKNASKYELYRRATTDSDYKKVAVVSDEKYKDKKITSGTTYYYKVRGYRTVNKNKKYSPFEKVLATAGKFGVKGVKAKSYLYRGLFTWDAVKGIDGYEIYACRENGEEVYKETTSGTAYLTGRLKKGKTYTYKIKSFKNIGGEKLYGESRKAKVTIESTAYGKSAGENYIEVCLETQTVNMVVKGKQYIKTPVVTGMYNVYDTTRGFHRIISKKSPARLRGSAGGSSWDVDVTYWLGFTWDGQGLHDSTWRTSGYGGSVYKTNGSHGCVNTPYSAMGKIYKKASINMPVIVY